MIFQVRSLTTPEHSGGENVIASTLELILRMMVREDAAQEKAQLISRILFRAWSFRAMRYRSRSAKVPLAPSFSAPESTVTRV
jgi:hypothetical protein